MWKDKETFVAVIKKSVKGSPVRSKLKLTQAEIAAFSDEAGDHFEQSLKRGMEFTIANSNRERFSDERAGQRRKHTGDHPELDHRSAADRPDDLWKFDDDDRGSQSIFLRTRNGRRTSRLVRPLVIRSDPRLASGVWLSREESLPPDPMDDSRIVGLKSGQRWAEGGGLNASG